MTVDRLAGDEDDQVLDVDLDVQDDADVDSGDADDKAETGDQVEDELVVTIDGDTPSPEEEEVAKAPEWVREVRKKNRELEREKKELERKLQAVSGVEKQVPALGKKPQLQDNGIDFDPDKFEAALEDWHNKKREVEKAEAERQAENEKSQKAWQAKLDDYTQKKADLKVRDFDDAEETVISTLSKTQQGIIVAGCKNPALVTYAIGKSPTKAKELSSITDPVQFAFAIANVERDLKVSNRKATTQPEERVAPSGKPVSAVDKTLERLMAEADKTGDRSKVLAYKRQQKAKK